MASWHEAAQAPARGTGARCRARRRCRRSASGVRVVELLAADDAERPRAEDDQDRQRDRDRRQALDVHVVLDPAQELGRERDHERADDRARDGREPADHEHRQQVEGLVEVELLRREREVVLRPHPAADAHQAAESTHAPSRRRRTSARERRRRERVLAARPQLETAGRLPIQASGEDAEHREPERPPDRHARRDAVEAGDAAGHRFHDAKMTKKITRTPNVAIAIAFSRMRTSAPPIASATAADGTGDDHRRQERGACGASGAVRDRQLLVERTSRRARRCTRRCPVTRAGRPAIRRSP